MVSTELHVSKDYNRIELDYEAGKELTIPITPTGPWSFTEFQGNERSKCCLKLEQEDLEQVLKNGIYVGGEHVKFQPEGRPPSKPQLYTKPYKKFRSGFDPRIVDVDTLKLAILATDDFSGLEEEKARTTAQHVLAFFGSADKIIDNILETEDRDPFYMLEGNDLLKTEREETTLYDGREWRIHYWLLNKSLIFKLAAKGAKKKEAAVKHIESAADIYAQLPDENFRHKQN